MANKEQILEHARKIQSLLIDINNHMDVVERHSGEVKIWRNPITDKWSVQSVKINLELES